VFLVAVKYKFMALCGGIQQFLYLGSSISSCTF